MMPTRVFMHSWGARCTAYAVSLLVDPNAAHHVVAGRTDFHRLGGDVDVGKLLELVVHRRQAALDVLGVAAGGDVEEHAAVRAPASGFHLRVDRASDFVTR